ncbi:3'-5' exoribonuclease [Arthrobacter sp. UYCu712]|uniref:3'-5' exoribonuclease domain-containing protein n=1 Tax=Arthrobacter sp. UYCu712 TaxID=3156340 RepID=UPI00339320E1
MKCFYDTEFHDDGNTIDLISIAIVAEDGREYYAVNADADWARIAEHQWLMWNVVPQLPPMQDWKPKVQIRDEVAAFLLHDGHPELWADYAAYDHVALAQLFGTMLHFPTGIPMYTNDLRSLLRWYGIEALPSQKSGLHDALEDARHLRASFEYVMQLAGRIRVVMGSPEISVEKLADSRLFVVPDPDHDIQKAKARALDEAADVLRARIREIDQERTGSWARNDLVIVEKVIRSRAEATRREA